MKIKRFEDKQAFSAYLADDKHTQVHKQFEQALMKNRQDLDSFTLDGFCQACEKPQPFIVDKLYGSQITEQGWQPNWRERLSCPECQLNNRQRAMIHAIKHALTQVGDKSALKLYAMEQITPLFQWLSSHLTDVECIGSEYLGEDVTGGTLVDGIMPAMRHENVEALSFADDSFDLIVSNDVLEHVNDPQMAIKEMQRVLKPQGQVLMSVPFYIDREQSQRRAGIENGELVHHLPEQYHGNPLSEQGSLVFHDYGWDMLDDFRAAGFADMALCQYWSYFHGYLGEPQYYFHATNT